MVLQIVSDTRAMQAFVAIISLIPKYDELIVQNAQQLYTRALLLSIPVLDCPKMQITFIATEGLFVVNVVIPLTRKMHTERTEKATNTKHTHVKCVKWSSSKNAYLLNI